MSILFAFTDNHGPKDVLRYLGCHLKPSRKVFGTMGIYEIKRYGHMTNISISIRGNVSYGAFLCVQCSLGGFSRGFYEEFSKNTQKSDQNEETK